MLSLKSKTNSLEVKRLERRHIPVDQANKGNGNEEATIRRTSETNRIKQSRQTAESKREKNRTQGMAQRDKGEGKQDKTPDKVTATKTIMK
jgi:hypothetical protein